jgi:hypothetical protein
MVGDYRNFACNSRRLAQPTDSGILVFRSLTRERGGMSYFQLSRILCISLMMQRSKPGNNTPWYKISGEVHLRLFFNTPRCFLSPERRFRSTFLSHVFTSRKCGNRYSPENSLPFKTQVPRLAREYIFPAVWTL